MPLSKSKSLVRVALLLAPLSLSLAACETLENMNPFDEKKKPISGDRRTLFPEGVPGVQYNAPPTQPTNSNIQLDTQNPSQNPNPEAQPQNPAAPRGPAQNNSDDPWAGQRR